MTEQNSNVQPTINEAKLNDFLGKVVGDFGAAMSVALAHLGDQVGLYKAMAGAGPLTSAQVAERSQTTERYVREWLVNQAAGGYVEYDPISSCYSLPPEHALALAEEDSPYFVGGGFQLILAILKAEPRIAEIFQSGEGMCWGEHDSSLFDGTRRFFRSSYLAHLVSDWLPALDGMTAKLQAGAIVADIGCGHGASTIIMAQAFPKSRFFGFDNHAPSIERARTEAVKAGVSDRVTFEAAAATEIPGQEYDLITFFDCLHDMGDPTGAARRACGTLKPDGATMIVEPMAGNQIEENLNPVGRVFSGASVLCCTPNAICSGGPALGTIATDQALREVVLAGGFSSFRRVTETPFNRVFEARP